MMQIVIEVKDGIATVPGELPPGVSVEVRDFDIEGSAWEDDEDALAYFDGDPATVTTYEGPEACAGCGGPRDKDGDGWDGLCSSCADEREADNGSRARRGRRIVQDYMDRYGESDTATAIADLLADLRHLADADGADYYEADQRAYRHYLAERADGSRDGETGRAE